MKRKDKFVLKDVAGEKILIPIGTEVINFKGLVAMNATAAFIWEKLVNESTEDELINSISNEYNISVEAARLDLLEFIDTIDDLGLLEK